MDCFNNFIGIKSCNTALTPRTGLFIEDLEGINLTLASGVAEEETGVELFQAKLAYSYIRLKSDVLRHIQDYSRVNTVLENRRVGKYKDTYLANAALDRGIKVTRENSRLSKIQIKDVTIKVNDTTVDKEFKIIDGDVETVYTFSGSAGDEVTVITDYIAKRDEVLVVMDNSDVQVNDSSLYDSDCSCVKKNYRYFDVFGWNGTGTNSTTYGMRVNVNMVCSDDDIICLFNHRLGLAALYGAGIEILKEVVESDRFNYITMFGIEAAQAKIEEWKEYYNSEIESQIDGIKSLLNRTDDICVECRKNRVLKQMP